MWRILIALGLAVTWPVAASAAPPARPADGPVHSGHVVAVDPHHLRLEETGRWTPHHAGTHRLTVALTPTTRIELVTRAAKATAGEWRGEYIDTPARLADIHPGDFVTVRTERRGRQAVADTVDVVRTSKATGAS